MSPRPIAVLFLSLCACASEPPPPKKVIEQRPPSADQIAAAEAEVARARAEAAAAAEQAQRARAEEEAARLKHEQTLAEAAAAKSELDARAREAAAIRLAEEATPPDPASPLARGAQAAPAFRPQVLALPADPSHYAPLPGFQAMDIPTDNPLTPEKAALGRQLYHDPRLSGDGQLSCYSCHVCEHGLTDGKALGQGAFGKPLTRSAPTMWNVGYHWALYWDGRAPTLEKQALAAWKGANMGATDPQPIVDRLNAIPGYRAQFEAVFGGPASVDNVPAALAAHMRTIVGGHTPWDRWQAGDEAAVSAAAKQGYAVFQRIGCQECHAGVLFTDMQFHNVGIGMDRAEPDLGRFKASNQEQDKGAFKTPTLRDVADSAPYFHDGSAPTLDDAVDVMLGGGKPNPWLSTNKLKPASVTPAERAVLLEFLRSLDERCEAAAPPLPPEG
jgi:cytochrome c peroxidase